MLSSPCQKNDRDLNSLRINNMVGALSQPAVVVTKCTSLVGFFAVWEKTQWDGFWPLHCTAVVHELGWCFENLDIHPLDGYWVVLPQYLVPKWWNIWNSISIKQYPSEEVRFCCFQMVFKQFISKIKKLHVITFGHSAFHYLHQDIKLSQFIHELIFCFTNGL